MLTLAGLVFDDVYSVINFLGPIICTTTAASVGGLLVLRFRAKCRSAESVTSSQAFDLSPVLVIIHVVACAFLVVLPIYNKPMETGELSVAIRLSSDERYCFIAYIFFIISAYQVHGVFITIGLCILYAATKVICASSHADNRECKMMFGMLLEFTVNNHLCATNFRRRNQAFGSFP